MSKSRAEELACLTPEDRRRYSTYRAWGLISGFVSLFSFWIIVAIGYLTPSSGFDHLLNIYQLAPLGFLIAIGGFVVALILRAEAKAIRENSYYQSATKNKGVEPSNE
jgi:hypothetical protein